MIGRGNFLLSKIFYAHCLWHHKDSLRGAVQAAIKFPEPNEAFFTIYHIFIHMSLEHWQVFKPFLD